MLQRTLTVGPEASFRSKDVPLSNDDAVAADDVAAFEQSSSFPIVVLLPAFGAQNDGRIFKAL
jgi:hypothetical protein